MATGGTHKREPARTQWELLARVVHMTFGDGNPPADLAWATMVLILKGKGEYRGIGLVEVAWKVYTVVVNCQLK